MSDALGVSAGPHAGAIDDCWDAIFSAVIILVEGDDQQAAMRLRPFGVGAEIDLEPGVAVAHRSVMHVVIEVGGDKAHCWQPREVIRKLTQVPFRRARVCEGFPWVVCARRASFNIADKVLPRSSECTGESRCIEDMVFIVAYALGRSAK